MYTPKHYKGLEGWSLKAVFMNLDLFNLDGGGEERREKYVHFQSSE